MNCFPYRNRFRFGMRSDFCHFLKWRRLRKLLTVFPLFVFIVLFLRQDFSVHMPWGKSRSVVIVEPQLTTKQFDRTGQNLKKNDLLIKNENKTNDTYSKTTHIENKSLTNVNKNEILTKHINNTKDFFANNDNKAHDINVDVKNKSESRHIAFLKVHKAASSTIQNILYRFGFQRNLSFVLSYTSHYISQHNAERYNPILPSLDKQTGKYDILCNHVVFNHTKFKALMYPDSVYLAIVRDPLDLFISSAYYYKFVWPADYLKVLNETTFIQDLIRNPEELEGKEYSRTFNYMAEDFGFVSKSVQEILTLNETVVSSFVSKLTDIFDFVMVVEYFDESLVILKRLLNWSLKDILYIKQNEFKRRKDQINKSNISDEDKTIFRKRNRLDYAIYEVFLDKFLKRKSKENDLEEEVGQFKSISKMVNKFCSDITPDVSETIIPGSKWNPVFSVDRQDCKLMMKPELGFWKTLLDHQKMMLKETT